MHLTLKKEIEISKSS